MEYNTNGGDFVYEIILGLKFWIIEKMINRVDKMMKNILIKAIKRSAMGKDGLVDKKPKSMI